MAKQKWISGPLGTGLLQAPGEKYPMKIGRLSPGSLREAIRRLSIELGPDHPKVVMLKKDLNGSGKPHPFPEKKGFL
jgi:hypothetical protein